MINPDALQFIYGGLPFLHEEDEATLREDLRLQMHSGKDRANVDEHFLQVRFCWVQPNRRTSTV